MKKVLLPNNVEMNIPDSNIGIFVSGGADSAILLFILMKHLLPHQTLVIFTTHSNQKGRSSVIPANRVIEYCIEKTGFSNIRHIQNFVDVQTIPILFDSSNDYLSIHKIEHIFTGITAAPPAAICEKFTGINTDILSRDPTIIKPTSKGIYYMPFKNKDKKYIAQLYKLYNAQDLFKLTRSCERYSNSPISYHCGKCWWCEERLWAFNDNTV